jgi:hypothetical protein
MSECQQLRKWEFWGFIITMPFAFLFHYLYELSGFNPIIGLIAPISESPWEHTKLLFTPFLIYALIEYFVLKPNPKRFFAAKTISLLFIDFGLLAFFYTYSGILGTNILAVDIFSAFLIMALAFYFSYKLYCSKLNLEKYFTLFVIIFVILLFMFLGFTIFAENPHNT